MRRLKDFPIRWFVLALVLIISMGQAWAWWPVINGGRVVVGELITRSGAIIPRAATAMVEGKAVANPWIQQVTAGLVAVGVLKVLDEIGNTGETLPGNAHLCPPDFSAPGWADCNTPPTTAGQFVGYNYCSTLTSFSITEACLNQASCVHSQPVSSFSVLSTSETSNSWSCWVDYIPNGNDIQVGGAKIFLCPTGYTWNGSACVLTDPQLVMWPSDGKITMMPTPNGWVPHPRDPDAISQTVPTGQSFTNSGIDPNNAPITETWYVLPDGGMKFEQKVQTNTEQGTTQVTTQGFETDAQGTVTNTWYFNTENSSLNISNATTNTSTQTVEANIDLPNDYAREATLQEINEKLESPTLTTPGPAPGELYEKTDKTFDTVITGFKNRILAAPWVAGATSFFSTNVSGTCPTWTIPAVWVFPAIPIDMQCSAAMENVWPVIGAIVMLTAAFIAWRWAFL